MKLGIISEDVRLCHQLAIMSYDNDYKIHFIDQFDDASKGLDCVVVDIDEDHAIQKCKDYSPKCMVIGAVAEPRKSIILNAKKAGCLIVLTKVNFSSNLLDILKKQI